MATSYSVGYYALLCSRAQITYRIPSSVVAAVPSDYQKAVCDIDLSLEDLCCAHQNSCYYVISRFRATKSL